MRKRSLRLATLLMAFFLVVSCSRINKEDSIYVYPIEGKASKGVVLKKQGEFFDGLYSYYIRLDNGAEDYYPSTRNDLLPGQRFVLRTLRIHSGLVSFLQLTED